MVNFLVKKKINHAIAIAGILIITMLIFSIVIILLSSQASLLGGGIIGVALFMIIALLTRSPVNVLYVAALYTIIQLKESDLWPQIFRY